MKIEEEIKKITSKLHYYSGLDSRGENTKAIVSPKLSEAEKGDKLLDTLARLLNGEDDVCIALCINNRTLHVANNKGEVKYARNYMKELRKFTSDPSQDNYNDLLEFATDKIYSIIIGESTRMEGMDPTGEGSSSEEDSSHLDKFKEKIKKYCSLNNKEGKQHLLPQLQTLFEKAFEEVIELKRKNKNTEANQAWEYLMPIEDTNIIVNAIINGELNEEITSMDFNINYIEGHECGHTKYSKNCKTCQANSVHAEMKVISEIFYKNKKEIKQYIGISKLACASCQVAIDILNEVGFEEYFFFILGTHGGIYPSWIIPDSFSPEVKTKILEKLKEIQANLTKLRESTSELPGKLSNVPSFDKGLVSMILKGKRKVTEEFKSSSKKPKKNEDDWKSIDSEFTNYLQQKWQVLGFGYEECKKWIDTIDINHHRKQAVQDPLYYAWLRDYKGYDTPRKFMKTENKETLNEEFFVMVPATIKDSGSNWNSSEIKD